MPEYRTPLPGILAALLEGAVNRILSMDDGSPKRLHRLAGRLLQLDIEGVGITLYFAFTERRVNVTIRSKIEADTVVSGSAAALFSMAAPEGVGTWGTGDSRVTITGDANLARDLERLFSQLDPDWEGSLSRLFGDVWGHQVASGLRSGAKRARETAGSASEMVDEYINSGRGPVVHANEFSEFSQAVGDIGTSANRIEKQLEKLERSREESE